MIKLKICALAFSTALNLTVVEGNTTVDKNELESMQCNSLESLEEIEINNPYITYEEIEELVNSQSQHPSKIKNHKENDLYDDENNEIIWNLMFEKVKKNNKKFLKENKENYLEEFSDNDLKEILKTIKEFILMMDKEYSIDTESTACKLSHLKIIKDTRIPALEVPYFAKYEGLGQTMTFLEDWDEEYYKITKAEETFHLLQGPCNDIENDCIKESVWQEPTSYSKKEVPSKMRTIIMDEYLAKINASKINPDYPIDLPDFKLMNLLEFSLLPNKDYQYQDTLTKLSINQNEQGFYNLFHASKNEEKIEVHKVMHNLDLIFGYFNEEIDWDTVPIEEFIKIEVLEINKILFKNILLQEKKYEEEEILSIVNLSKEYSLYILRTYLEELELLEHEKKLKDSYLEELEKLEKALFQELNITYKNPLLYEEYQNYEKTNHSNIKNSEANQRLIDTMESDMKELLSDYEYRK